MSFKVTNFGTNRKLICDILLVINTNLHPILHHFQVMTHYWSNFRFRQSTSHFNALAGGDPLRISGWSLPLQKLEWLCYLIVEPHDRIFIHLHKKPERDGGTDRQTDRLWLLQCLHCKQCRCTVKKQPFSYQFLLVCFLATMSRTRMRRTRNKQIQVPQNQPDVAMSVTRHSHSVINPESLH